MKTRAEIYDIIYNQLGLKDQETYKAYCDSFYKDPIRVVSEEEINLLSPDNVNNEDFWRVAEEIFKTDPVSNCLYKEPASILDSNRRNLNIYLLDGIIPYLQFLQKCHSPHSNVFEIGPGYGALKYWIEANTLFNYTGIDSYPKVENVLKTNESGLMDESIISKFKGTVDVCVASNVFQHLSKNQRRAYYKDVSEIIKPYGSFIVSQFIDNMATPYTRSADGKLWLRHYGQFTEIQRQAEVLEDVWKYFDVDSALFKRSWMVLHLKKKAT